MKFIFITVISLALSGCFYQTVDTNDLKYAVKQCGGLDKIEYVSPNFTGDVKIKCDSKKLEFLNREQ